MKNGSSDSDRLFEEIKQAAFSPANLSPTDTPEPKSKPRLFRRNVPNYEVLEEIHRGGQGVVFKAKQLSTNRIVALKFILQGTFATPRQKFRFEREVDLASRLNHPGIVTIYDSGISENQPYCAMEFVDGEPLSKISFGSQRSGRSSYRRTVELFLEVCEAVGFAHERGVIHRDLKPANILVDGENRPHVLDFGLAKLMEEDTIVGHSPRTMTGEFVGTLAYASPEQAQANPELMDTRSDVYSLGVVLYELLTGRLPYDVTGSIVETLSHISGTDPTKPSRYLNGLDDDLETILLKSLSKDPSRRYANAKLLAADLKRYLDGDAIDAKRDSTWYVFRKTVARHRRLAMAASAVLATMIVALLVVSIYYWQAVEDRNLAKKSQAAEKKARGLAVEEAHKANLAREDESFNAMTARIAAADASLRLYDVHDAVRNLSDVPKHQRDLEWWLLLGRVDLSQNTSAQTKTGLRQVRHSVDGRQILAAGRDAKLRIFDSQSLKLLSTHEVGGAAVSIALHPNGDQVAVGLIDGAVEIYQRESFERVATFQAGSQNVNSLNYSKDGNYLVASCGWDGQTPGVTSLWYVKDYSLKRRFMKHEGPHFASAIDPEQKILVTADFEIRIWDFETGEVIRKLDGHGDWISDLVISPSGKWIVTGGNDGLIKVWSVKSGRLLRTVYGHQGFVRSVQYTQDGRKLISSSDDRTIRVWNAWTWVPDRVIWGSAKGLEWADLSPDESTLVSSSAGMVKLWPLNVGFEGQLRQADFSSLRHVRFGKDDSQLASGGNSGAVKLWKLNEPRSVETLFDEKENVTALDFSRDGKWVAWGTEKGMVRICNLRDRKITRLEPHRGSVVGIQFDQSSQEVFSGGQDRRVIVTRLDDLEKNHRVIEFENPIRGMAVHSMTNQLAVVTGKSLVVKNAESGELIRHWERKPIPFEVLRSPIAFSPDGKSVAFTGRHMEVHVNAIESGKTTAVLADHVDGIQDLSYSPSGRRLLTTARDGKIKFWDTQRRTVVYTLRDLNGYANTLSVSPDERRFAVGTFGGSILIWDTKQSDRK